VPRRPQKAQEIAAWLEGRLRRGEFTAGEWLPPWDVLAHEFPHGPDENPPARGTVRAALKILADRALIEVVPGRGARPIPASSLRIQRTAEHQRQTRGRWRGFHLAADDAGLTAWSETTTIQDTPVREPAASHLGVPEGTAVVERARRHGVEIAGEQVPVMLSWTWFHPDVADHLPVVRELDTGSGGVTSRFVDAGYQPSWQEIVTARAASASEARALDIQPRTALTEVWRPCTDEATGRVLEVTLRLINPALHELVFP
jgi:GntR family transcriptional regulator